MITGWKRHQRDKPTHHRTVITRNTRKEVQAQITELKKRGYEVITVPEIREEVSLAGNPYYASVLERKAPSQ